jgi:hypothetical protein
MARHKVFDIDAAAASAGLTEPVVVRLAGKEYTIPEVLPETLDRLQEMARQAKDETDETKVSDSLRAQIALFTGADESEFEGIDVRLLALTASMLQDELVSPEALKKAKAAAKKG